MKFSMSEAWRDAMAMMSANREVLLIVAGIFFLLPSLGMAVTMPDFQQNMMADPQNAQAMMAEMFRDWWWLLVVIFLAQIVGYLALLALLRDTARPTVGEALQRGLAGLVPAIGVNLIIAVGAVLLVLVAGIVTAAVPVVGVILLIVCVLGMIYLAVKMSLVMPVIAVDRVSNPLTVIARSWALTKGNSLRLFLFFLLLGVVYVVLAMVIGAVVGLLSVVLGADTAVLVNGVISGILGAIATVIFVAVIAAIHRQLSSPPAAVE